MQKIYSLLTTVTNDAAEQTFLLNNANRSSFHGILPTNADANTFYKVEYEYVSMSYQRVIDMFNATEINTIAPFVILCNLCQFGHLQTGANECLQGAIGIAKPELTYVVGDNNSTSIVAIQYSCKTTFVTNNVWNQDRIIMRTSGENHDLRGIHKFVFTPLM